MASFNALPRALRAYIAANLLLVVPCVALAAWQPAPANWTLVAALVLFTILFSTWKLELSIFQARMTPVFATVCVAMLLQGLAAAVLCSAIGALVTGFIRPKGGWKVKFLRPQAHHLGLNLANATVAALMAGLAFNAALRLAPKVGVEGLFGVAAFTTVYFLVNTWGIAVAVSLQQGLPVADVWRQNFLWTAPGFYASAVAGLTVRSQFQLMGGWALLFLPPVYLIYHSYKTYTERMNVYGEKLRQDSSHIRELSELSRALISRVVSAAADEGNAMTGNRRAQRYAVALAQAAGLAEPEQEVVAMAAMVHDVGRLNLPGYLRNEALRPTAAVLEEMRSQELPGGSSIPASAASVVEIVLAQNERWDGSGHPLGLRAEQIPVGGRILAVVGMFDLLTSRRDYRDAMSPENALKLLRQGAGKQFDPDLVARFEAVVAELGGGIEQPAPPAVPTGNGWHAPSPFKPAPLP